MNCLAWYYLADIFKSNECPISDILNYQQLKHLSVYALWLAVCTSLCPILAQFLLASSLIHDFPGHPIFSLSVYPLQGFYEACHLSFVERVHTSTVSAFLLYHQVLYCLYLMYTFIANSTGSPKGIFSMALMDFLSATAFGPGFCTV